MGDGLLASERASLLRFVTRLVGDGVLADDVVQDALLRAHASRSGFQGRARIGTWLAAIALNVMRDHYRSPAKRMEVAADEDALEVMPSGEDLEQELLEREMGACIAAHLMALPARQSEVLALHDMGGADHAELAEALGMTEGAARVALHRARTAFRARLRQHCQLSFGSDAIPCAPLGASTAEPRATKESGRPARLP